MTETTALRPQQPQESLSGRVARRLRGCLAENRISQTDLARALHMPQQKVSRKVNGQTPFTLDELEMLAMVFDIELDALIGAGEYADRPIGWVSISSSAGTEKPAAPGGGRAFLPMGRSFRCAIRDSNPEPADSGSGQLADVVPLRERRHFHSAPISTASSAAPSTSRTRRLRLVRRAAS